MLSFTHSGSVTNESRNTPAFGKITPMTTTSQATEARASTDNQVCRSCGTLPKSVVVAQPNTVFSSRPA